jgi:hypothetical protein
MRPNKFQVTIGANFYLLFLARAAETALGDELISFCTAHGNSNLIFLTPEDQAIEF